jgi:monovalent cation/proton antiporter MnhG/PhaG subunit
MALAAAGNLAVDVLLAAAVGGVVVCVLGVLLMPTTFDRLHYAAAATTLPTFLMLAAVLVREHVSSGGLEAIAAVAVLFLLNPVLTIATSRAARAVDYGSATPLTDEEDPGG